MNIKIGIALFLICAVGLSAQSDYFDDEEVGDAAVAERYLHWAENAIGAGNWSQARAALERAADFADVSSDISYLLALVLSHEGESRRLVLQTLEQAINTNRWKRYTEAQARLLEADQLIIMRRYSPALRTLAAHQAIAGENADATLLRLAALKGLIISETEPESGLLRMPVLAEFRRRIPESLNRYPRDPRFLRILFDYALAMQSARGDLDRDNISLVEIGLRRLPFLLESDPELAWMAAPFVSNVAEARRLVAGYRSGSYKPRLGGEFFPHPASLVPALNLGLLDDFEAVDELFEESVLERNLIIAVGRLLRSEEGRNYLVRNLHSFSGAITDDEDRDGYPESRAMYHQGNLQEYYSDTDQDGITDMYITFIAGNPQEAELATPPSREGGREQAFISWERYPAVQKTELGDETWLPSPGGFPFAPIVFEELGATGTYAGLMFPRNNPRGSGLNRRMLSAFAVFVQRPSAEFPGGVEQVLLERGIPIRAEVMLNGAIVAVTEYENGNPTVQRLDLDLDGRMETVRHFDRNRLQSVESDWHGEGRFGSERLYRADGSVVYTWDMDGDGIREYSEIRK
jgi:hypothetical protein